MLHDTLDPARQTRQRPGALSWPTPLMRIRVDQKDLARIEACSPNELVARPYIRGLFRYSIVCTSHESICAEGATNAQVVSIRFSFPIYEESRGPDVSDLDAALLEASLVC